MRVPLLVWALMPALVSGCLSEFRATGDASGPAPAADALRPPDAVARPDAAGSADALRAPDAEGVRDASAGPDAVAPGDTGPTPDAAPPTPTCPAAHEGALRGGEVTARSTLARATPRRFWPITGC